MKNMLITACLLSFTFGCSLKKDFVKMQRQVDYLEASQKETQAKLAAADSANRAQSQTLNEINAALWDLSEKITAKVEALDQLQKSDTARPKVDLLPIGQAQPEAAPSKKSATNYLTEDYKKVYDAAYLEVTRRSYDLAVTGFREFIRKYPHSNLADNAQYWIGESFYAQRKFKDAAVEFERVIGDYPNQDKVPAAMLKAGLCRQELGEKAKADQLWQKLLKQYPKSQEALLAKEKLKVTIQPRRH
ncbi:MAG: tol-pal system protein YbgF [Candidatus Edwardsbacteria bacterium]|nr:tol-pal system protein YbgF [Candidatus Edwardsbacteria bacterium]